MTNFAQTRTSTWCIGGTGPLQTCHKTRKSDLSITSSRHGILRGSRAKTYGHVTYGCASCCAEKLIRLFYDPLGIPDLGTAGQGVQATDACTGHLLDISSDFDFSWTTANHAIATVDAYGTHTGQSEGTTSTLTCAQEQIEYRWDSCPVVNYCPGGHDNVHPTISQNKQLWFFGSGNTPPTGFNLGGTSATLTANNAGNGTYVWTITNGTSKMVFENNSSTITKTNVNTVGISSTSYSTQANDVAVQLQFTPSGGSQLPASYSLSIDSPYKLVSNGQTTNSGAAGCSPFQGGSTGFASYVPYSMKSFFGVQIANEYINEDFASWTDDYSGNNWPTGPAGSYLSPDGTFSDNICVVNATTPPSLPPQSPLLSTKIDHASQSWYVGSSTPASGVEVQANALQRFQDHGTHTAIQSPVR